MSANNYNQSRNIGVSSPFGSTGMVHPNMPPNFNASLQAQAQPQQGVGFAGQFQLSQAQALAQSQAVHAQLQAQLQAQGMSFNQAQTAMLGGGSNSSSPMILNSGSANARRIPQRPPVRPPGPMGINMNSPMRSAAELTPAARKKQQKLPGKQTLDRVAAILPESALYTQLLEFESRVDASLAKKKVDIQEALKIPPSVQKTLRIYVFNTFANQTKTVPQQQDAEPPTWTLKILGRILEDPVDPDQAASMKPTIYPKFSSFFKRVTISLDQRLYTENQMIIWDSSRAAAHHEGFEVKRKGDQEFTATIRLEMHYAPEKFKLSPALSEVLRVEVDTRPRIIAAIWHYVKAKKLQVPDDPSFFICDPPLRNVFGEERVKFTTVLQKISEHLNPPQPIILEHQIKLSGNNPATKFCYDVLVDVPLPIQKELNMLLANTEKHKELETCDESICTAIKKIQEHRRRRAFFLGFSQSPVEFINAMVESHCKDLRVVSGESGRSAVRERRSDYFDQPWVDDAVIRYIMRKPATGNDGPGS